MNEDRINLDAMYDTATAGQLMGGIERRDVCIMINNGIIEGRRRPSVRGKLGIGKGKREQLVVPGYEIMRFNSSMRPVVERAKPKFNPYRPPRRTKANTPPPYGVDDGGRGIARRPETSVVEQES